LYQWGITPVGRAAAYETGVPSSALSASASAVASEVDFGEFAGAFGTNTVVPLTAWFEDESRCREM